MSAFTTCANPNQQLLPQRLTIEAVDYATVLMPVLVTLHRRRCQITEMSYAAADGDGDSESDTGGGGRRGGGGGGGGGGHLEVSLLSPRAHASCVPRWLANVVGVLRVDEHF